ncbi:MAG TPA: CBS domain-containing protein [Steroidobacteraceae bacterium]|nr:CBS domain-containing protein [Steroidobacteraceae bacterium]
MNIGTVCSRDVCVSRRGEALASAASQMMDRHVGALVVVEPTAAAADRLRPVGIITDRDIVCGQVSPPRDLFCLTVDDVMTADPLVLEEGCGIGEGIRLLAERGVRRAPVVDRNGALVGVASTDDLLRALSDELGGLAQLIRQQPGLERRRMKWP